MTTRRRCSPWRMHPDAGVEAEEAMRHAAHAFWIVPALALAARGQPAAFKPYPGAAVDQKATKEAKELAEGEVTIYTTRDSFEKVLAFYKPLGKEYRMPAPDGPL